MTDEKIPMTSQGKKLLEEELKKLISEERPKVVKAIELAREHGDISENADYTAAKERQGFIEARIQHLSSRLARAQVIDISSITTKDRVVFGAKVFLEEPESERNICYQIVGEDEANIKAGKIAITAPLARAMIGKSIGDEIIVHAPKGKVIYNILDIQYAE